jgi:hypothetical protein
MSMTDDFYAFLLSVVTPTLFGVSAALLLLLCAMCVWDWLFSPSKERTHDRI